MSRPHSRSSPVSQPDIRAVLGEARAAAGMTQAQLGEALGVPANTIARWERGELAPQHPRMLELALRQIQRERRPRRA